MIQITRACVRCEFCDKTRPITLLAAWRIENRTFFACDNCDRKLETVFPHDQEVREHP